MPKKYILKNKDKQVLSFDVEIRKRIQKFTDKKILESQVTNINIISKSLIPLGLILDKNQNENLENWINARRAPTHRKHINNILTNADKIITDYIDISFGLSLNDSYWVIQKDIENKFDWESVNLYKNNFDERLALAAFGILRLNSKDSSSLSPEFTTGGGLVKCWHKNKANNKIELLKGIEENANQGKENYAEFYMSQIADKLGLNCIKYDLKKFNDVLVSSCELFCDEKKGFIQISKCIDKTNIKKPEDYIEKIIPIYGMDNFCDLMLFDALIYNTDRHLGNFGMMIDNDSQKLLYPAPIFDNGNSFFNELKDDEYGSDLQIALSLSKSWFGDLFDDELQIYTQPRHAKIYEALLDFKFTRHAQYNLDDFKLNMAEKLIQQRSQKIINLAKSKTKIYYQIIQPKNKKTKILKYTQNEYNQLSESEKQNCSLIKGSIFDSKKETKSIDKENLAIDQNVKLYVKKILGENNA